MKADKKISHILTKYLRRQETVEERQALYKWYDELDHVHSDADAVSSQKRTKAKLWKEINPTSSVIKPLWYKLGAVAGLLLIGYFGYTYFNARNSFSPMEAQEIAAITPGENKATITLADGKIIDLSDLDTDQSLTAGNGLFTKDASGQITYVNKTTTAHPDKLNTLKTPKAGQYSIVLSDGTKVFLNAESSLSYPETFGNTDRIVMLQGEAYFEVTKDPQHRKFIVKTAKQSTEVLGTKFNINAYEDEPVVKTTLAEGSVRVNPNNKHITPIILKPDEQTVLQANKMLSQQVDASYAIGWTQGQFCFDGTNSEEVLRQIARWYDVEIEYANKNAITYSGKIPKNLSLDKLIKLLEYADINVQAVTNQQNKRKLIIN
ncbi:sigma factor regulatory protein, FecR/PupR family [Sphingobacterium spiritivorum ATCC 33300]|uniref:Sigma factor regulatory protein, FecR/PupR family n=1 Tax=Sphingobacterium spiritivorum ATCC 33300 TaxID=525372 RepID=C2G585_SPHSI|nr:FecR domain-containing protein [Sphingobacterium spiritivorum]EEI89594.1 sigma factor regulatory protein, FecR/PupR family [Sphingobacterium spiritivorum ATCC 33300]QQS94653.1 FecR domain-containing protein [Sphingobacterium spiritivorum]